MSSSSGGDTSSSKIPADWNLSVDEQARETPSAQPAVGTVPFDPDQSREATRGDLARGLLWLLTFAIGGMLVFVGLGHLEGSVLTQSVFPSLVALAGTALGFYFGSQTKAADAGSTGQPKNGSPQ